MEQRHNQEEDDLNKAHEDELHNFNSFWEKKLDEYNQEGDKMIHDMQARHQAEENHLRD